MNIFSKTKTFFTKTEARKIFLMYLLLAFLGGLLLYLPFSLKEGIRLSFIDALFISVSEISSTGLTPVSLVDNLSLIGIIISILLLEIGGIGIVLMMASLTVFLRRKLGVVETNIIAFEQNQFTIKNIFNFVKNAVIGILSIQVIFIIIMSLYLFIKQPWALSYGESLLHSVFIAVSSFANAGFEIFPSNNSFVVFQEQGLYFPQILTMILIFLGGIGFWPLAEMVLWIKKKIKKEPFKFSFFAKIFVFIHFITWLGGSIVFYLLETNNIFNNIVLSDALMITSFMSVSVRSAGFYNVNINNLREVTKFFLGILMFIGAAPNSSGGGIRLTTFILVISSLYSFGKNKKQTFLFKNAIKDEAVKKAYVVFTAAIMVVVLSVLLITIFEDFSLIRVLFEVLSAFGTVGLSLNVTPLLSSFSKVVLIIVMFIGRIGILTFVQILENKKETSNVVNYVPLDIMVG